MEKQQTAVEWLTEKLRVEFGFVFSDNIFNQAKEMQEKQMIDYGRFCVQCHEQGFIIPKNNQLCK
jgi:hypothetical protein